MDIGKLLDNVGVMPGVEGTCIFDLGGKIHVNRLPAFLNGDPLAQARSRIETLYRAMTERLLPADDFVLHYADHWLLLRRAGNIVLVVLATRNASLSSVRMITNILVRNLTPESVAALAAPAGAVLPEPATAPMPARPTRMYRGQPY